MVTTQQIQERRQELEQATQKIKQTQQELTREQLMRTTPIQRQRALQQFKQQKQKALQQLKTEEERLKIYEKQQEALEGKAKEQQLYSRAVRVLSGQTQGLPLEEQTLKGIPKEIIKKARKETLSPIERYKSEREIFKKQAKEYAEFKKKIKKGEIYGVSTPEGEQFYEIIKEEPKIITPQLSKLEISKPTYVLPEYKLREMPPQKVTIGARPEPIEIIGKPKPFAEFALFDVPTGIGIATGKIAKKVTPPIELTMPKTTIPQKVTISPTPEVPVFPEVKYKTPLISEEIGKVAGTLGTYAVIPSGVLLAGGSYLALQKEIPIEKRISAGMLAGFGAVGVTGKAIRYLKEPIIKPLPKPTPTYEEITLVQPMIKKGAEMQKVISITKRTTPQRMAVETTRFEESVLGKAVKKLSKFETEKGIVGGIGKRIEKALIPKPTKVQIQRPRVDTAWTPVPITIKKGIIKEPAYFVTMGAAKKPTYVTAYGITGATERITPEMFKALPKTQKYVVQKIIEKRVGRPVSLERVGKFIPKEGVEIARGQLAVEKLMRLYPKTKEFRFIKPGKRVTRVEAISFIKEKPPAGEVRVFRTITGAKDITKPFARATGKIPVIKGTTFIKPPKDITPPKKYFVPKKMTPKTKVITKVKTTFPGLAPIAAKVFPKPRTIQIKETKIISTIKPPPRVSLAKPTADLVKIDKVEVVVPEKVTPKIKPILIDKVKIKETQIARPKLITKPREVEETITIPKIIPKTIDLTKITPKLKERTTTIPRIVPGLRTKTKPSIIPIRVVAPIKPPTPKPPKPPKEPTKIKIPVKIPSKIKEPEYIRRMKKRPELFIPYVRRYGKFIPITEKPVPKKKALKIGVTKLRRTLAATLQLRKPTGEIVPISPTGKEFRVGKVRVGIVQKAQYRLGTPGEKAEIIKARKAGGIKIL